MRSQYIERRPASRSSKRHCYYCDTLMRISPPGGGANYPDTRTRDHIHIASRGGYNGRIHMDGYIENVRNSCAKCNSDRAMLGHCCGLLMMILLDAAMNRSTRQEATDRLWVGPIKRRRQVEIDLRKRVRWLALQFGI